MLKYFNEIFKVCLEKYYSKQYYLAAKIPQVCFSFFIFRTQVDLAEENKRLVVSYFLYFFVAKFEKI